MNVSDINGLIVWLMGGGGAAAVASFVLERLAWFQKLSSDQRGTVVLGVSLAIALAATAFKQLASAELINAIAPYAAVVIGIVTVWLTTQAVHRIDLARLSRSGDEHA